MQYRGPVFPQVLPYDSEVTPSAVVQAISLLVQVVRYSIQLHCNSSGNNFQEGRLRNRLRARRTRDRQRRYVGTNKGSPDCRWGFDRIAGLSELFRMGVWQLSRTSRTAPYWSGRKKS
jgi:hypothetical protein